MSVEGLDAPVNHRLRRVGQNLCDDLQDVFHTKADTCTPEAPILELGELTQTTVPAWCRFLNFLSLGAIFRILSASAEEHGLDHFPRDSSPRPPVHADSDKQHGEEQEREDKGSEGWGRSHPMAFKESLEASRGEHVPCRAAEDCRCNILPNGVQHCAEDGKVDGSTGELAGSVARDGSKPLGTPGTLLFVPEGAGSILVVRPEHELDGLGKSMHGHHGTIVTP